MANMSIESTVFNNIAETAKSLPPEAWIGFSIGVLVGAAISRRICIEAFEGSDGCNGCFFAATIGVMPPIVLGAIGLGIGLYIHYSKMH